VVGGAAGAVGAGVSTGVTPIIAQALKDAGLSGEAANAVITAVATGIGAVVGGTAGAAGAYNEVRNNYLTDWQKAAKNKELGACAGESAMVTAACKASVQLKYALIDAQQDAGLAAGVFGGIGYQSVQQAAAVVDLVKNLPETLVALKALVTDADFRAKVGDQIANDYAARIDLQTKAYDAAGWDGSVTAGVEAGRLAVDVVTAASAAVGAAKLATIVVKAGVNATASAIITLSSGAANVGQDVALTGSLSTADGAANALNGLNLNKSLASQQQLSELISGRGTNIAGSGTNVPLRDVDRLVAQYGGQPGDWSKVSSSSYKAADGSTFEIHAYRNAVTGQLVEPKSIPLN
jgi:filamentous hemagglutinin